MTPPCLLDPRRRVRRARRSHAAATLRAGLVATLALALALLPGAAASADPPDRAKRMYDRLVGVPPTPAQIDQMVAIMGPSPGPDQLEDAARFAIEQPDFYNVSLVNFVTPWTNVERTVFADLNDYTATVIGMIRDEVPFDQVLSADLLYVADPALGLTPYSHTDNQHYQEIQSQGLDLSDPAVLVQQTQSGQPGSQVGPAEAAGVVTTRAAGEAFFSAGTNRRMWRFTGLNFLCRDLEQLKDVTRPADGIRQDVSRSPGGDSEIFHTQCVGCHAGMDPLAGAYAFFEWDADAGRVVYTPGQVQGKYLINTGVFPGGHITTDDGWQNLWRVGQNSALGWAEDLPGEGYGPQSLGVEVAQSRAFAECQVQKVFEHVCFRPPQTPADADAIRAIATGFEENGTYDLKQVFARVAVHCTEGE